MTHLFVVNEQRSARSDVAGAVALAAPLWFLGLVVFAAICLMMDVADFTVREFSIVAVLAAALATIALFRAMARDLQRDSVLRGRIYRRMMSCTDGVGDLHRNVRARAMGYVSAAKQRHGLIRDDAGRQ